MRDLSNRSLDDLAYDIINEASNKVPEAKVFHAKPKPEPKPEQCSCSWWQLTTNMITGFLIGK